MRSASEHRLRDLSHCKPRLERSEHAIMAKARRQTGVEVLQPEQTL